MHSPRYIPGRDKTTVVIFAHLCSLGDEACRFIMAHPTKIQAHLDTFFDANKFSGTFMFSGLSILSGVHPHLSMCAVVIAVEQRQAVLVHKFLASKRTFRELDELDADSKKRDKQKSNTEVLKGLLSRWKNRGSTRPSVIAPGDAAKQESAPASAEEELTSSDYEQIIVNQSNQSKELMKSIFKKQIFNPRHGRVTIDGHRHLLIRAEAISYDFFKLLSEMFPEDQKNEAQLFAAKFIYDFGRSLGTTDQRFYAQKIRQQVKPWDNSFSA